MTMRSLLALCFALTLSACGGPKTGEGYTSGICKDDVVEDYAKLMDQNSSSSGQWGNPDIGALRDYRDQLEDFLKDYPGVSCEISSQSDAGNYGGQYGWGGGRIEHQKLETIKSYIDQAIKNLEARGQ